METGNKVPFITLAATAVAAAIGAIFGVVPAIAAGLIGLLGGAVAEGMSTNNFPSSGNPIADAATAFGRSPIGQALGIKPEFDANPDKTAKDLSDNTKTIGAAGAGGLVAGWAALTKNGRWAIGKLAGAAKGLGGGVVSAGSRTISASAGLLSRGKEIGSFLYSVLPRVFSATAATAATTATATETAAGGATILGTVGGTLGATGAAVGSAVTTVAGYIPHAAVGTAIAVPTAYFLGGGKETDDIYEQEAKRFVAKQINDVDGKKPETTDYKFLSGLKYKVAEFMPNKAVKELNEKSIAEYQVAIEKALDKQSNIKIETDKGLRWLISPIIPFARSQENADKYDEASSEFVLLTAAKQELENFAERTRKYNAKANAATYAGIYKNLNIQEATEPNTVTVPNATASKFNHSQNSSLKHS